MKKVMAIVAGIGLILSVSLSVSAERKPKKTSSADTAKVKIHVPQKPVHKQKEHIKKIENKETKLMNPEMWNNDRPLLMKEKRIDTLQKKAQ